MYRVLVGCRPATADRARGTWVGQQDADPNSATAPNAIPKRNDLPRNGNHSARGFCC